MAARKTAGAGALSAKHEEILLGHPRPTVNWLLCGTVKTVPYGSRGKRADQELEVALDSSMKHTEACTLFAR